MLFLALAEVLSDAAALVGGVLSAGFFGAWVPAGIALPSSAGVRIRVAVTSVLEASIACVPACIGGAAVLAVSFAAGPVWAGGAMTSGVGVALPVAAAATGVPGGETAGYEVAGTEAAMSGLLALLPLTVAAAVFVAAITVLPPL